MNPDNGTATELLQGLNEASNITMPVTSSDTIGSEEDGGAGGGNQQDTQGRPQDEMRPTFIRRHRTKIVFAFLQMIIMTLIIVVQLEAFVVRANNPPSPSSSSTLPLYQSPHTHTTCVYVQGKFSCTSYNLTLDN